MLEAQAQKPGVKLKEQVFYFSLGLNELLLKPAGAFNTRSSLDRPYRDAAARPQPRDLLRVEVQVVEI